ncbi:hypothetical protein E2C06_15160 [Dankookia rubra]|uniref:DUF4142 domain-containing protein n=1 Tax=Dankookia rubra TaxID=1442381 RepID=A0A4R5QF82_9PROT|nr:hypothetical protein [Dankookia rubra]TDH61666.1 hypothetical protein E2C06_15160 [Dankookia rubra]
MRVFPALAAMALLALPLAPACAQSVQETARGATPATGPGAALQSYALQLQAAETRLARAREAHAAGRTESQAGAASQERIELMQVLRAAWSDMQKVPQSFSETVAYQQAQRRMQHDLSEVGPDRSLSKEKADTAAQDALQVLSELRGHVVSAAGQAGASMPAPAVQGGGANR